VQIPASEEECPICYETLLDPISPCIEQALCVEDQCHSADILKVENTLTARRPFLFLLSYKTRLLVGEIEHRSVSLLVEAR
jgi:hypothetical protein